MLSHALRITVDGCFRPRSKACGWGAVLRRPRQEWIAFGRGHALTSEAAEFRAVLEGIQVAVALELMTPGVRVQLEGDNKRVMAACAGRAIPLYGSMKPEHAALDEEGCRWRDEIHQITAGHDFRWIWIPRNSRTSHKRADALASIGLGLVSPPVLNRAGLTQEVWRVMRGTAERHADDQLSRGVTWYLPVPGMKSVYAATRTLPAASPQPPQTSFDIAPEAGEPND